MRQLKLDFDLRAVHQQRRAQVVSKTKAEKRQERVQQKRERAEVMSQLQNPEPPTGEPTSVRDFRVVVDNSLQGLGKQLRYVKLNVCVL